MDKKLEAPDIVVLKKAKKASIIVTSEEIKTIRRDSFFDRLFRRKDPRIVQFEAQVKNCQEMNSILKLSELGLLRKEASASEFYQDMQQKLEKYVRNDIYKITDAGHQLLLELYPEPESDKIINLQDFKNNNCIF